MRFSLPALSAAQILIAKNPEMGVESRVFASAVEVTKLGRIVVDSAGVITWTAEPGASLGAGMDIHLKLDTALKASAAPVVTMNCTLVGPIADSTAVATLAIPSWVGNQGQIYPIGYALDFVPAGVGNSAKLVTAITGFASITNITSYTEFTVWGSPASSNFAEIGWKRGAEGPYNTPSAIAFANGYNPAAAIKSGRPEIPELTLSFAHIAAMEGMARYNGHRASVLLKVIKDKAVHSANILYTGFRPSTSPNRGDGNDEVVETSTGPYEDCMQFDAL